MNRAEKKSMRSAVVKLDDATRPERILKWYMQQEVSLLAHDDAVVLSPEDDDMREKLEIIFSMLTDVRKLRSQVQVAKQLTKMWRNSHGKPITYQYARQLINDAQFVFGQAEKLDKQVMRVIHIQLRRNAINHIQTNPGIEDKDKAELVDRHLSRIEKIGGLEDKDTIDLKRVLELLQLPDAEFTEDPAALDEMAEDITHQDVTNTSSST